MTNLMDSRQPKFTQSANKEYMDQRVRGHDFLAYFRSHLMTICLVFWFLTISVSVAAAAIYLIKKLESEKHPDSSTDRNKDIRTDADTPTKPDTEYVDVDLVDFLIDTFYHEGQGPSEDRADEAGLNSTSTNFTVPDYGEEKEEEEEEE